MIEILVVLSMLTLVMGGTVALFLNVSKVRLTTTSISKLKKTGNNAIQFIERKVRNASEIKTFGADNIKIDEIVLSCGIYDSPSTRYLTYNSEPLTSTDENITIIDCSLTLEGSEPERLTVAFTLGIGNIQETFGTTVSLRTYGD